MTHTSWGALTSSAAFLPCHALLPCTLGIKLSSDLLTLLMLLSFPKL